MNIFLEEVAEDLHQKFGADFQQIAIVFNHRRPAAYLQKHLANCIGKPFWSPDFFTLQSFFAHLTGKKKASTHMQMMVLHGEMQTILAQEGITNRWNKLEDFFTIAKVLISDFEQILRERVDAQKLYKNLQEFSEIDAQFGHLSKEQIIFLERFWGTFSSEKQTAKQEEFIKMWRRMPILFHRFYKKLNQLSYHTEGQLYHQIASEIQNYTLNRYRKVIFVGFNALTQAEIEMYQYWQKIKKALFYFDVDEHYINDTLQEAGLFLRSNLQQYHLENQLTTQNLLHTDKNMQVYAAKGHTVQASMLNDCLPEILEKTSQEPSKLSKTAIILLDEKLLMPSLQYIPKYFSGTNNTEIPINISMGFSMEQNPIYSFLNQWIALQRYYIASEQKTAYQAPHLLVQSFLWSKFSGVQANKRNEILDQIVKNQYKYVPIELLQSDFFNNTSAYFSVAKTAAEVFIQIKTLLNVAKNVVQSEKEMYTFEWQTLQKLSEALEALEIEITQLIGMHLLSSTYFTSEFALELWNQQMATVHINPDNINHDALQVMGLLESRSLNFETLIFMGANEGVLPKTSLAQSFIPDSIRRAFRLPVSENLDAVSAYMFYRLVQRSKCIHLIYNDLIDENNSGELSRFVRQIEYELPFKPIHHQRNYKISVPKSSKIEIFKDENIQKRLHSFLLQRASLSPSAFTMYLNCELQYYFQYIADIRQAEVLEEMVPAFKIGNILHHVMESLYTPYLNIELNEEILLKLKAESPTKILQLFNIELFNNETYKGPLSGSHEIIKIVLNQYVQTILNYDLKLLPFKIIQTELSIAQEIDFKLHGKLQRIKFKGFIDRVDALLDEDGNTSYRIVDYKTGRDELVFLPLEEKTTNGSVRHHFPEKINKAWIQTMLYSYMYEQAYNIPEVEPNLYVLRKMNEKGTLFEEKISKHKEPTEVKQLKSQFLEAFKSKLTEMFDMNRSYKQTNLPENCAYCAYKNICGR